MATFISGQILNKNDFDSFHAAIGGDGVISGLLVSPKSPATMQIEVASGTGAINASAVNLTSAYTLTVSTADPTNPRKDIVVFQSDGTPTLVDGTPEAAVPSGNEGIYTHTPSPSDVPTDKVLLGEIWVGAGATSIIADDITDKRVFLDVIKHASRHASGGVDEITSPLALGAIPSPLTNKIITRIQAGLEASRPAGSNAGDIYYATDTNKEWIYDGSVWQEWKGVVLSKIEKLDHPHSVLSYGGFIYCHKAKLSGKAKVTTVTVNCTGADSYCMGARIGRIIDGGSEVYTGEQQGTGTFSRTFTLNDTFESTIEIKFYARNCFDGAGRTETINYWEINLE